MGNAATRVLARFRQAGTRGVTAVTGVMAPGPKPALVTPITAVTPATCRIAPMSAHDSRQLLDSQVAERAGTIEFDASMPREWAEALSRLDPARPPLDVPVGRWLRFIDDCDRFVDQGWASAADSLGWRALELFGCDAIAPLARLSRAGLLWLIDGRLLHSLTANVAVLVGHGGSRLRFYRGNIERGGVPVWDLFTGSSGLTENV